MNNFFSMPQFIPQFCGIGRLHCSVNSYPAIYPAVLRDSRSPDDSPQEPAMTPFLLPKREEGRRIRTPPPDSPNAGTYRPIKEIVEEMKVIEAEARETVRAML